MRINDLQLHRGMQHLILLAIKVGKMVKAAAINFSYFSPYDSLYEPLEAAISQAQAQNLNPQETDQYVMNLMFGEDGPVMKIFRTIFF